MHIILFKVKFLVTEMKKITFSFNTHIELSKIWKVVSEKQKSVDGSRNVKLNLVILQVLQPPVAVVALKCSGLVSDY